MQSQDQNNIYKVLKNYIPNSVIANKNRAKTWVYGYNEKYDVIIISRDGTLGDVYEISNVKIALPKTPKQFVNSKEKKENQFWQVAHIPKILKRIQTIFQWHEAPVNFKAEWVDYIEKEFDRREQGYWFLNNGFSTYITGTHYMYLQWTKIDIGNPDFREANRIFYIFWEACKADKRSF